LTGEVVEHVIQRMNMNSNVRKNRNNSQTREIKNAFKLLRQS